MKVDLDRGLRCEMLQRLQLPRVQNITQRYEICLDLTDTKCCLCPNPESEQNLNGRPQIKSFRKYFLLFL